MSDNRNNLNQITKDSNEKLKDGTITEKEWYQINMQATTKAYTSRKEPHQQCGHSGTEETWMYSRIKPLLEILNKSGSFIDIGCANGYICESLYKWTKNSPIDIEYYGMDICDELINIAKERQPIFVDNYYTGNVVDWIPPVKFDYVRAYTLNTLPKYRRKELIDNLYVNYLKSKGRLILGSYTEPADINTVSELVQSLGYTITGYSKKSYINNNERKLIWIDKP